MKIMGKMLQLVKDTTDTDDMLKYSLAVGANVDDTIDLGR
jgi:hypothetical protein